MRGVIVCKITEQCLPILKTVITSKPSSFSSCKNEIFHEINSRQRRSSVIKRFKESVCFGMATNFDFYQYSLRNFAFDAKQGINSIPGFFNVLIQPLQEIFVALGYFPIAPIFFTLCVFDQTVFIHDNIKVSLIMILNLRT